MLSSKPGLSSTGFAGSPPAAAASIVSETGFSSAAAGAGSAAAAAAGGAAASTLFEDSRLETLPLRLVHSVSRSAICTMEREKNEVNLFLYKHVRSSFRLIVFIFR